MHLRGGCHCHLCHHVKEGRRISSPGQGQGRRRRKRRRRRGEEEKEGHHHRSSSTAIVAIKKHQRRTIIVATSSLILFTSSLSSVLASSLPFAIKTFGYINHLHSKVSTISGHIKHLEGHLLSISSSWGISSITNISNISCFGSSFWNISSCIKSIFNKMGAAPSSQQMDITENEEQQIIEEHQQPQASSEKPRKLLCRHPSQPSSQPSATSRMRSQQRSTSLPLSSMTLCYQTLSIRHQHRRPSRRCTTPLEPL